MTSINSLSGARRSHYVSSSCGLQLHVLEWPCQNPASKASPCLLLHGFTNDAHIWDSLAKKLQRQHQVFALDFRGHGDSEWQQQGRYELDYLVNDVHHVIQQLGLDEFHLIGHSLGARVATLYAAAHQPRLASFMSIDTGPEVISIGVDKIRQDAETTPTCFASVNAYSEYLSNIYFMSPPEKILHLAIHGLRRREDGQFTVKTDPAFSRALWKPQGDCYTNTSTGYEEPMHQRLWRALRQINVPALVVKGQMSAVLSRQVAEQMAYEALPKGQLALVSRSGHAVMMDNATEFEKLAVNFLTQSELPDHSPAPGYAATAQAMHHR